MRSTRSLVLWAVVAGSACTGAPTEPTKVAGAPAEAKVVETKIAEAPEAKAPEVPEAPAPEAKTPEAKAPEAVAPVAGADAVTTKPVTVYAVLVDPSRKIWSVDVTNFAGLDVTRLEKKLQALEEKEEEPALDNLKAADLPAGMKPGEQWTLLTPEGREPRKARRFDAMVSGGSGTMHLSIDLGPTTREQGYALALRGAAPESMRMVAPTPIAPAALKPKTLERVLAALVPKLDPELRERAPRFKVQESHVKLFPGRFPGGRSHVVFVLAEAPPEEESIEHVSGVLFARPGGEIEFVAAPDVAGAASLVGLVDLDGDGFDEVIYEDHYHEGWSVQMIDWQAGAPRVVALTGDGL